MVHRNLHLSLVLAAGLSGSACSLIVPGPDDFTYDLYADAGADGGTDAAVEDAGPPPDDAGFDGATDAGPCGVCTGDTPYCDPVGMACVACTAAEHCDDGDFCTVDRCGLDFVCRADVLRACVAQVEAGGGHTCVRFAAGEIQCWGGNFSGQLGIGTSGLGTERDRPAVVAISDAVQLTVGSSHSCVLRSGGRVSCWGSNSGGKLGQDPATTSLSAVPLELATGPDVLEVAAGGGHTCVRFEAGNVRCWGRGLLNGSTADSFTGVDVPTISDAVALSAGDLGTCVVRAGGTIACWGSTAILGDGVGVDSSAPVTVVGLSDAVGVGVAGTGDGHACALRASGGVACWGFSENGELGDGTLADSLLPVQVRDLTDARAISAGGSPCALRAPGQVVCWGRNDLGQLGDGMPMAARGVPGPVSRLSDAVYVSAGGAHACAIRASGAVVCWGNNSSGEIGDGTRTMRTTPVDVF